jgi:hypothetical protein
MRQENQLLHYITTIFNIKADNVLVVDEIIEDLSSIVNADGFKEFIKKQVTKEENRHLSGYQKFLKILDDFKKEKGNKEKDQIEIYCKRLIEKCRLVCIYAWENKPDGKKETDFIREIAPYMKKDGKSLFNKKDIQLLNEVGGVEVWSDQYASDSFLTKLYFGVLSLKSANIKQIRHENEKKSSALIGA